MRLTLQQVFDRALHGLRKQRVSAVDLVQSKCKYLTEDGRRCAIGMCIDDPKIARMLDSGQIANIGNILRGVSDLETDKRNASLARELFYEDDAVALSELQHIHDGTLASPESTPEYIERCLAVFEEKMRVFAESWKLDYEAPCATR